MMRVGEAFKAAGDGRVGLTHNRRGVFVGRGLIGGQGLIFGQNHLQ